MRCPMDADVLTTRVVDGIAVITLGTERRIYIDQETSDALFEALSKCAGDPDIRVPKRRLTRVGA